MSKRINSKTLLGIPLFISFFLLLFSVLGLNSYCKINTSRCINIGPISVPNDTPSQYLGSFIGAYLTFTAFYWLEVVKKKTEAKPKIKISFNKEDESELIVCSEPHYIFVPTKQEHIEFGKAYYLRVKVTNEGDKIASGCSGYLKTVHIIKNSSSEKLKKFDSSVRLLWPYEQKVDYRSNTTEQIPSGASEYLDILVSYDSALKPETLDASYKQENIQLLKLKTQPQPLKYANLLKIDRNSDIKYELTIEVYANECEPSRICLTLEHKRGLNMIRVYSSESRNNSPLDFPLCESLPSTELSKILQGIPKDITLYMLYDLL
ncbi:MAG: hypothetical protein AAGA46_02565 [Cyanobacteria bacterium P01_F01_bin.13]